MKDRESGEVCKKNKKDTRKSIDSIKESIGGDETAGR